MSISRPIILKIGRDSQQALALGPKVICLRSSMFPRDKRVQSVRDRTLTNFQIGASIKRKLYELEAETRSPECGSSSSSQVPLPPSPLIHSPLPPSPLARVQAGRAAGSVRRVTIREPALNRSKTANNAGYRGMFKNRSSFKKSFNKARAMTLRKPAGETSSFKKKSLNRVMSLKQGELNRGSSVNKGGFNRVLSMNRKQLQELTGEEVGGSDNEDQYTVIIQRNDKSDVWSMLGADEARLSSMRKFRFSSIRRWPDSDESEEEEEVSQAVWDGYLSREEQYELRKKIFHKGEYMILNYALILMLLTAVFSIIFVSVWHAFQENDVGMYVMLGVALSIVVTVISLVKIRLRLARRAPGGYKFRRDEKSTVIDNVGCEPDVEKCTELEKISDV